MHAGCDGAIGGQRDGRGGAIFQLTALTNVARVMKIASEETFGPVVPLFMSDTVEDVIEQANDLPRVW